MSIDILCILHTIHIYDDSLLCVCVCGILRVLSAASRPCDAGREEVERLARDVLFKWAPSEEPNSAFYAAVADQKATRLGVAAAETVCRHLYHLLLGPLMGGPSMVIYIYIYLYVRLHLSPVYSLDVHVLYTYICMYVYSTSKTPFY